MASNQWYYQGKSVESTPEGATGFVYRIAEYEIKEQVLLLQQRVGSLWKKVYIGKKNLTTNRKKAIGKREIKATKTRKRVRQVVKESNWQLYNSSCKELQDRIKESPELFYKEILHWTYSKKQQSFLELEEQILHDVLRKPSYNSCIGNKYWARDIQKPNNTEDNEQES